MRPLIDGARLKELIADTCNTTLDIALNQKDVAIKLNKLYWDSQRKWMVDNHITNDSIVEEKQLTSLLADIRKSLDTDIISGTICNKTQQCETSCDLLRSVEGAPIEEHLAASAEASPLESQESAINPVYIYTASAGVVLCLASAPFATLKYKERRRARKNSELREKYIAEWLQHERADNHSLHDDEVLMPERYGMWAGDPSADGSFLQLVQGEQVLVMQRDGSTLELEVMPNNEIDGWFLT